MSFADMFKQGNEETKEDIQIDRLIKTTDRLTSLSHESFELLKVNMEIIRDKLQSQEERIRELEGAIK